MFTLTTISSPSSSASTAFQMPYNRQSTEGKGNMRYLYLDFFLKVSCCFKYALRVEILNEVVYEELTLMSVNDPLNTRLCSPKASGSTTVRISPSFPTAFKNIKRKKEKRKIGGLFPLCVHAGLVDPRRLIPAATDAHPADVEGFYVAGIVLSGCALLASAE